MFHIGREQSFTPTTAIPGYAYDIAAVFSDPEDDTLIYIAQLKDLAWGSSPLPDWLTINPDTGLLSGTPGSIDTGALTIEVTATEAGMDGLAASDTFSLDVQSIAPSTGDIPFTFKTEVISASAASMELYDGVDYTGGSTEALIKLTLNADMAGFTSAELSHISSIAGAALDMKIDWSQFESISDLTGNVGEMFHVENLVGTGMFLGANTKDANPSLLDGLAISSLRTDEPALTLVDNITPADEREIDLPSTLDLATIYLNPIDMMIETSMLFGATIEGNQGDETFVQSLSTVAIVADRIDATVMTADNELLDGLTMNLWDNGVDLNQGVAINHGEIEVDQTINFDAIKLSDPDAYDMDLTIGDALDVLRHIVNLETLTGAAYHAADVDNDDDIDIGDALDVLRHIVKLDTIDTFDLIDETGNRVTQLEDSNPSIPPQWTLIANGDVDQSGSFATEYSIEQVGTPNVPVEPTAV